MKSLSILPNLEEEASLLTTPFCQLSSIKSEALTGFSVSKIPKNSLEQVYSATAGDIWVVENAHIEELQAKPKLLS